jgi:hypothetical protein
MPRIGSGETATTGTRANARDHARLATRPMSMLKLQVGIAGDPPVLVCVMAPGMVGYHNTRAALVLGCDRSSRSSGPVKTPVRHEAARL